MDPKWKSTIKFCSHMLQPTNVYRSMKIIPIGKNSLRMKPCHRSPSLHLVHPMVVNMNWSANYPLDNYSHINRLFFGNFKPVQLIRRIHSRWFSLARDLFFLYVWSDSYKNRRTRTIQTNELSLSLFFSSCKNTNDFFFQGLKWNWLR